VAISADAVASGAKTGLEAIMRLGRARVGDKTLVDAYDPFVTSLCAEVGKGRPLKDAWNEAARVSTAAAEATAQLAPKLGRARSHTARSLGHPDAGCVSLALCARVVGASIKG
jgi:dihydroxyacetone kinase